MQAADLREGRHTDLSATRMLPALCATKGTDDADQLIFYAKGYQRHSKCRPRTRQAAFSGALLSLALPCLTPKIVSLAPLLVGTAIVIMTIAARGLNKARTPDGAHSAAILRDRNLHGSHASVRATLLTHHLDRLTPRDSRRCLPIVLRPPAHFAPGRRTQFQLNFSMNRPSAWGPSQRK
jgi:hypothetical protein